MRFLAIFSIIIAVSGSQASLMNTRDRRSVATTNAKGAGNVPSAILNASVKAIGKISAQKLQILKTASEVFTLLNNATDGSFADVFFKIEEEKLTSTLRGVWSVASIVSGRYKVEDDETADILKNITQGLEKLSDKVLCKPDIIFLAREEGRYGRRQQLSDIGLDLTDEEQEQPDMKVKIDEIYFNTNVVVPVNSTSWSMVAYLKNNTEENKARFIQYYNARDSWNVDSYIVMNALYELRNLIVASDFETTKVDEMRGKFARYLLHAYFFENFNSGLKGDNELEAQDAFAGVFTMYKKDLWDSLKKASKYYNENFFSVYVKENILNSALDASGGSNNCDLAQSIVDQLKSKCPRHKYTVIVSNGVSKPDQYAHHGIPKRMIMKEEHNGKSVIAFLATKPFANRKNYFSAANGKEIISADVASKYSSSNLHSLMDFGKNREGYQTAVYKDYYKPCLRSNSLNVSDTLEFEVPSLTWGIFPSSEKLKYFVVF